MITTGALFLYLAAAAQLTLSGMEWWRAEDHEKKARFVVTGILQVAVFVLACGVIWWNTSELATARADASASRARLKNVQARLVNVQAGLSNAREQIGRLSGQNQDLQARLIQQVGISRMIAKGCIANPQLRKKAERFGAHFQRSVADHRRVSDTVTVVPPLHGKESEKPPKK